MDLNAILSLLGAIVTVIGACVIVWKGIIEGKKTLVESKKLLASDKKDRADAFITYEQFVAQSAENNLKWAEQVEQLQDAIAEAKVTAQEDVAALQKIINALELDARLTTAKMEELERSRDDLKDWAERLVHQVKSLRGVPVKMRSRTPKRKEVK